MDNIFNDLDLEKADFIIKSPNNKLSDLQSYEIKNLAIVWCYYSGRIEGNTYSFVETETLLKDGVASAGSYDDIKMLKNLYNTFIGLLNIIKTDKHIDINPFFVKTIHSSLTDDLLKPDQRGALRTTPVKINGTDYTPPKEAALIELRFNEILSEYKLYTNPLEQAVFLHCNMAKLQPFLDGNKRTSRTLESIVMINADIIPVYSTRQTDILRYRDGLLHFYETGDYSNYVNYFLDKQIERINEISPNGQQFKIK